MSEGKENQVVASDEARAAYLEGQGLTEEDLEMKPFFPSGPKYPEIEVTLSGEDGNAFAILGKVRRALRDNGVPHGEVMEFQDEATRGDYDALLRTVMEWVSVE